MNVLVEIKQKSQVTIPSGLVRQLNLKPGDKLEVEARDGCLVFTPVAIVPRDQLWFYAKDWQADEQEVDRQIGEGRVRKAKSLDELTKGLGLDKE